MPEKQTVERAKRKLRKGASPSTAAGEFVREEMHHIRAGKHGARSPEQAIAIGLSKARRAGVPLRPPAKGKAKPRTREAAARAYEVGQGTRKPRAPSRRRQHATEGALKREPRKAASHRALSAHAKRAAHRRGGGKRSEPARSSAATRQRTGRKSATRSTTARKTSRAHRSPAARSR